MSEFHRNKLHLNLTHRLRTGWSVKTGSFESHGWGQYSNSCTSSSNRCGQPYLLTDDERKAIIQVNLTVKQYILRYISAFLLIFIPITISVQKSEFSLVRLNTCCFILLYNINIIKKLVTFITVCEIKTSQCLK